MTDLVAHVSDGLILINIYYTYDKIFTALKKYLLTFHWKDRFCVAEIMRVFDS